MCRTCMTATRTNSFDAREGRSGRHGRGGREAGGAIKNRGDEDSLRRAGEGGLQYHIPLSGRLSVGSCSLDLFQM